MKIFDENYDFKELKGSDVHEEVCQHNFSGKKLYYLDPFTLVSFDQLPKEIQDKVLSGELHLGSVNTCSNCGKIMY